MIQTPNKQEYPSLSIISVLYYFDFRSLKLTLPPRETNVTENSQNSTNKSRRQLLSQLLLSSETNDIYRLFGLSNEEDKSPSTEEIEKKYQALLHHNNPQIFQDPSAAAQTTKSTIQANTHFLSVLKQWETRGVYHKLVRFRRQYEKLDTAQGSQKEIAMEKLQKLKNEMLEKTMPMELVDEVQLALDVLSASH